MSDVFAARVLEWEAKEIHRVEIYDLPQFLPETNVILQKEFEIGIYHL